MSRRPASVTQADVARILRAAKQAGAAKVEIQLGDAVTTIYLTDADTLDHSPKVVL
jgi:hypothetical protein